MKKICFVICLFLAGCSKKQTLDQLKKEITQQSQILYTEKQSHSQIQLSLVNEVIVLDSLLEIEPSFIILVDPKQEKIAEVKQLLQQINKEATLLSNDVFVALCYGEDIALVQKEMLKLKTK